MEIEYIARVMNPQKSAALSENFMMVLLDRIECPSPAMSSSLHEKPTLKASG
jgi:hypothetical protein